MRNLNEQLVSEDREITEAIKRSENLTEIQEDAENTKTIEVILRDRPSDASSSYVTV